MTTRQNILKLALDKSRKKGKEEGKAKLYFMPMKEKQSFTSCQ